MADNLNVTPGAGATVAADEVGGALYQRIKVALGADGAAADLAPGQGTMAASVPVVVASDQSALAVTGPLTDAELRAAAVTVADASVAAALEMLVEYAPVGAHTSTADLDAVVTLTKPGGANQLIVQALSQNARYTLDGVDPTATHGFRLTADAAPVIIAVPGAAVKLVKEGATKPELQYQWVS
jgi:hypothetical protein